MQAFTWEHTFSAAAAAAAATATSAAAAAAAACSPPRWWHHAKDVCITRPGYLCRCLAS